MQTNFKTYKFDDSISRIDDILNSTSNFDDKDEIPKRDTLTYTNGYYVKCCALFVDLRGSSTLPQVHQKKVLAKIYRSYISEIVAILNGFLHCKEISIVGDCVSAIFSGKYKQNVNETLDAAGQINSLIQILNYKLEKKGYTAIKAGIGLSWGRVLMIKAGYNGSGLNEVVYMGDAVNQASKVCSKAMKDVQKPIVITKNFYDNLKKEYQEMFTSSSNFDPYYSSSAVSIAMNNWLKEQKEKDEKKNQNNSLS
ncbi:adenylate/guanylate cyclase domain-containing protein [Rossellomorea aquimaris]|uniref:adenylate/guanylate cyclase domain-containing protein n=1 Tax=Rossellomorea aquimaris TaxID=189382 RepID=UPI001CD5DA34|nr:adenylate/guanylate cyclase domain-containing protein [Rossellomorea aquimaris]MCA1057570.1 adenylate/guanylate cyclase domain-containing protein [Rossellomorea aquimaris]